MRKHSGRDGREQHHFEVYLHRERKLQLQQANKWTAIGWCLSGGWCVWALVSYLVH